MPVPPRRNRMSSAPVVLTARRRIGAPVQRVAPRARTAPFSASTAMSLRTRTHGRAFRAHAPPSPPPQTPMPSVQFPQEPYDLLARCGIDSPFGRAVSRVLVFLLLFQPVYVALGAELETEQGTENEQQQLIDEERADADADADIEEYANTDTDVAFREQETESTKQGGDGAASMNDARDTDSEAMDDEQDGADAAEESSLETQELDAALTVEDDEQDEVDTGADAAAGTEVGEPAVEQEQTSGVQNEAEGDSVPRGENETHAEDSDSLPETEEETGGDSSGTETGTGGGGGGSGNSQTDETDETDTAEDTDEALSEDASATNTGASDETETGNVNEGDSESEDNSIAGGGGSGDDASESSTTEPDDSLVEAVEEPSVPDVLQTDATTVGEYSFGEGDCTLVADGEFYCVAPTTQRHVSGDPRVYAERDREGDREIHYFDGVEVTRITNNEYDDYAPVFDEDAGVIVWQANVQDRLQVFYHDVEHEVTRQITTSRQNSSNPDIEGDHVVWQEWVDTNWEVFLADVELDGVLIEQLTDNDVHDMFPQVYDGLVTWQREKGSSWEVIVHNLKTGEEYALEKDEDTKYENPRFVLLFDSKHDNGDIETIGYDLDTGEMMELGTKSRPIPADPVTPSDETPEAIPREGAAPSPVKAGGEDGDGGGDGADSGVVSGSGASGGAGTGVSEEGALGAPQSVDVSASSSAHAPVVVANGVL